MEETSKTDKSFEERIAELQEQVKAAQEKTLQAEKERDEAIRAKDGASYQPGFRLPPFSTAKATPPFGIESSSKPQLFSGQGTPWKWNNPFVSTTNLPPTSPTVTNLEQTPPAVIGINNSENNSQPPQGQPIRITVQEPLVANPEQSQFSFGLPPAGTRAPLTLEGLSMERLSLLEGKIRAIEGTDPFDPVGPADLCLVPGIVMPPKFKIPEFDKYTGVECPRTHLKVYCNKMSEVIQNEPLLIHIFQESLAKHALSWYMGLDKTSIRNWRDLSDAFYKQYKFNTEVAPDRSDLQNMEKREGESVKSYAQRWRELAARISPLLSDKELVATFVNTFKTPYYTHLISNPSSSFSDMVLVAERVEQGIKMGKVIVPLSEMTSQKTTPDEEVDERVSLGPPCMQSTQDSFCLDLPNGQGARKTRRKQVSLPPLPIPLREVFDYLLRSGKINPVLVRPRQTPPPKGFDPDVACAYHSEAPGHALEDCSAFKVQVHHLIKYGDITFEELIRGSDTTS